jgi:hypothetical protein
VIPLSRTQGSSSAPRASKAGSPARSQWSRMTACARALGGPRIIAHKAQICARVFGFYASSEQVTQRLELLASRFGGPPPTRAQFVFAGLDMVRYLFVTFGQGYVNLYREQQLDGTLISLLRVLNVPEAAVDLFGLASSREGIIEHVLQVTHVDVTFDLHLLDLHPGGLDDLERAVHSVLDGTHPRIEVLRICAEDDQGYHRRLLDIIDGYRRNPATYRAPRRLEVRTDPSFAAVLAEEMFSTMPSFLSYARRMPDSLLAYRDHYRTSPSVDVNRCDPVVVERVRRQFDRRTSQGALS